MSPLPASVIWATRRGTGARRKGWSLAEAEKWLALNVVDEVAASGSPLTAWRASHTLNHMVQYSSARLDASFRRAVGRDSTRRSRAARACRRVDHRPGRHIPHDADRHEEARRRLGAGRAGHHREGRARADLQARPAPPRGRDGLDRGYRQLWAARFDELDKVVEELKRKEKIRWTQNERVDQGGRNPSASSSSRGPSTRPARIVFDAWTKPELFKRWWVPKSLACPCSPASWTFAPGAATASCSVMKRDDFESFGKYLEVTPPSRLVWTNDEGEGGAVTTVTFEEQDGNTLLVVHDLYPSKEALDEAIASGSTSGTARPSSSWTSFSSPWAQASHGREVVVRPPGKASPPIGRLSSACGSAARARPARSRQAWCRGQSALPRQPGGTGHPSGRRQCHRRGDRHECRPGGSRGALLRTRR